MTCKVADKVNTILGLNHQMKKVQKQHLHSDNYFHAIQSPKVDFDRLETMQSGFRTNIDFSSCNCALFIMMCVTYRLEAAHTPLQEPRARQRSSGG